MVFCWKIILFGMTVAEYLAPVSLHWSVSLTFLFTFVCYHLGLTSKKKISYLLSCAHVSIFWKVSAFHMFFIFKGNVSNWCNWILQSIMLVGIVVFVSVVGCWLLWLPWLVDWVFSILMEPVLQGLCDRSAFLKTHLFADMSLWIDYPTCGNLHKCPCHAQLTAYTWSNCLRSSHPVKAVCITWPDTNKLRRFPARRLPRWSVRLG